MELILWRHAEAEDGVADLERALTKRGRRQARRMAEWLRPLLVGDWRILASPARRTIQTVKALELPYEVREALGPGAPAQAILREAGWPRNAASVLVVGHQPTLGQVAARLMGGAAGELAIKKGALWWFAGRGGAEAGDVVVKAVLGPDQLEG